MRATIRPTWYRVAEAGRCRTHPGPCWAFSKACRTRREPHSQTQRRGGVVYRRRTEARNQTGGFFGEDLLEHHLHTHAADPWRPW